MRSTLRCALVAAACGVVAASSAHLAAAAPQGPGCSMLTPAQIEKVLGEPFGAPAVSPWLPAFSGQPWGSQCRYSSQKGPRVAVDFIVYIDPSAAEAKQTFDKLVPFFNAKSKPAIGDEAYVDAKGAIHVVKGKVRYYIALTPQNEKQMNDLAASIAARI